MEDVEDEVCLRVRELTTEMKLRGQVFRVVDSLSFDLKKGKTLAIVGESGSGKSVTALTLMGILPSPPALPPKGEAWLGEIDLFSLSDREMRQIRGRRIAMIFQDPMTALNPVYTVGFQLGEVAEKHLDLTGPAVRERVVRAMREVGIGSPESRIDEYPHQLSGGMKQRVMIAMALLAEPEVLIADEPTTALDVTIQAQVLDLMRDLQKRKGTAILLITHDMGVVAEMADEVAVMYASQMIEKGTVHEVFDSMSHPYTKGLFNCRPHIQGGQARLDAIEGSVPSVRNFPEGCHFNPRCRHAMPTCRKGRVPVISLEGKGSHEVACWLYDESLKEVGSGI